MPKRAVKKTISLPEDLLAELQQQADAEKKTLSGVIQEELRLAKRIRVRQEFHDLQRYWSRRAQERGILSEHDLDRYLSK
jgi:predicted CopG family antitoxin